MNATHYLTAALGRIEAKSWEPAEWLVRKAMSAAMREGNRRLSGKCMRALHCIRAARAAGV